MVPAARVQARRAATVDEALSHAVDLMGESGVGAVSVSEIARRMGIKPPSLYKYFGSLHEIYDQLFARGMHSLLAAVDAPADHPPGLERLVASSKAMVRWCIDNPALSQLLFSRPVPGFVPSREAFAPSLALWNRFREDLAVAARKRQLSRKADSDDALRLLTIVLAGITAQQLANEPDATYANGAFTGLTDDAIDMFLTHYTTRQRKERQ